MPNGSFKLLIQSFIAPRGRDLATLHSVVAEFDSYAEAQEAAAQIEHLPAEQFPHTKVLRLYAPQGGGRVRGAHKEGS